MTGRNRSGTAPLAALAVGVLLWSSYASAQWITFVNESATRLDDNPPGESYDDGGVLADPREKDYGVGDFDNDGDTDMVVVRKEPLTTTGKEKGYIFMNEGGVLTNRTAALCPDLLTACNNRDVEVVDVNYDGWVDFITAPTRPVSGDLQSTINPRVYINLGEDGNGDWLGFDYNYGDQRIDDYGTKWPFFCSIVSGVLNNSTGRVWLWFTDYAADTSVTDPPGGILGNRLLSGDVNGFFTDVTQANVINSGASDMSGTSVPSNGFGTNGGMVDLDGDGDLDIFMTQSCSASPHRLTMARNNGSGVFTGTNNYNGSQAAYHYDFGDLNNDGKMDYWKVDDSGDNHYVNTGNNAQGWPVFTSLTPTGQSSQTTSGFGGNVYVADLNNDNFKDTVVCDEDVDLGQSGNRMAIFHNLGNTPNVTLASTGDPFTLDGTLGTRDTYDTAILDINGDTKLDLVVGTKTGTKVFMQPVVDTTPPQISSTTPANGFKDIKQDRGAGGVLQGTNQVTINFNEGVRDAATNGAIVSASFSITLATNLGGLTPPVISSVTNNGGNSYTLNLATPIKPGAWNTITALVEDTAGNAIGTNGTDLAFLPGDANGSNNVTVTDVLTENTGINTCIAAGTCSDPAVLAQYDVNRSGVATPADSLRLVQLMNGINTQNAWSGVALPAQP